MQYQQALLCIAIYDDTDIYQTSLIIVMFHYYLPNAVTLLGIINNEMTVRPNPGFEKMTRKIANSSMNIIGKVKVSVANPIPRVPIMLKKYSGFRQIE